MQTPAISLRSIVRSVAKNWQSFQRTLVSVVIRY